MLNRTPKTRYYGSKRKIINTIWNLLEKENLEFDSVLDVFGGTGTFSYKSKLEGKKVIYNDIFKFNYIIGKALIQNSSTVLKQKDIDFLVTKHDNISYKTYIKDYYEDIYFLDNENELIDIIVQNIMNLKGNYTKALAYYALIQTMLIKRPFNTFHRKNLSLRTRDVKRTFGNKTTWEKDLIDTFKSFILEANSYVFSNSKNNRALNSKALSCKETADLIYIDPPYISQNGSHVDYHSRYHFLEAIVNYNNFTEFINENKLNKEVQINKSPEFESKKRIHEDIEKLISKYKEKTIVFSYRNNGIPSPSELETIFKKYKNTCKVYTIDSHYYALNDNNDKLHELVYILK